jgi:predicted glycoside hydrolase/deacetylase ChbG (UPF0249 family)
MSTTPTGRSVIINADDFGRSHGINRGVVAAHEHGIVTSASLMVSWPASRDAALYTRDYPELDVGLHLDLAEWTFTSEGWQPLYERVALSDPKAIRDETWHQIERFDQLVGILPSHLDSHQHTHRSEPARSVVLGISEELGIVVRGEDPVVTHRGDFYGQSGTGEPNPAGITSGALIALFESLNIPLTEISCHPAHDDESGSAYGHERDVERRTLCDAAVWEALDRLGITRTSFREAVASVAVHREMTPPPRLEIAPKRRIARK